MKNSYNDYFKSAKKAKSGNDNPGRKSNSNVQPKTSGLPSIDGASKKLTAEDILRAKLMEKRKSKVKPAPRLPIGIIAAIVSGLGLSLWGFMNAEVIDSYLDRVEIKMLGESQASEKKNEKENPAGPKAENAAKSADKGKAKKVGEESGVKNWTQEELSYLSKLQDRKNELDRREENLAKLEEELHKQKAEVESRIKKLTLIRDEISRVLKDRVNVDQEKVDKLVDFYSNMKAQNAAQVIAEIDEDLAVEILGKMKKKNAAEILNLIEAKKAQRLSEKFAGYKR